MNHHPSGTIVVGIDGSTSSDQALRWAVDEAVAQRRPLTLLHATGPVAPAYAGAVIVDVATLSDALRADGREVLARARQAVEERAPELETHLHLELAEPREALLAQSMTASLIVLGSRGRGHLKSLLLGSVGVAVARHAHCPVVIHRPAHPGTVRNGVLVAADGSEASLPVLEFAYREAELHDLPLTVVHCWWDIQSITASAYAVAPPLVDREQERLELAESMAGMAEKYPDVRVSTTVLHGTPETRIAPIGDRMNLLVVGAHQGSTLHQLLVSSVSVALVERAGCPVAVVPVGGD